MTSQASQSDPARDVNPSAAAGRRLQAGPTWFDVIMNIFVVVLGAASAAVMLTIAMDWITSVL